MDATKKIDTLNRSWTPVREPHVIDKPIGRIVATTCRQTCAGHETPPRWAPVAVFVEFTPVSGDSKIMVLECKDEDAAEWIVEKFENA